MKLLYFDDFRLGIFEDGQVYDVTSIVENLPHSGPHDLIIGLIKAFPDYRDKLLGAANTCPSKPVNEVRIRPPLPKPGNIDCMAVNYMEDGRLKEPAPINGFHKASSAIIGPGDTMVLPDVPASIFEGEAELGIVIGKPAKNVARDKAYDHIFGYVNFIDGSARDLPPAGNTFFQMKSRDTFAPIGPFLVTADEIPDPQNLQVRLWVNGNLKQDFNTDDMAHDIPSCIEWLSSIHPLEPGDLIATGTNHGGLSGFQDGDEVAMEVDGLGRLEFDIRDDLKRTWSRDTRLEHTEKGLPGRFTPQLTGKYAKTET